jgi:hypothetical protein
MASFYHLSTTTHKINQIQLILKYNNVVNRKFFDPFKIRIDFDYKL